MRRATSATASRAATTSATVPSTHAWRAARRCQATSAVRSPVSQARERSSSSERRAACRRAADEQVGLGPHAEHEPAQIRHQERRLLGAGEEVGSGHAVAAIDAVVGGPAGQLDLASGLGGGQRRRQLLGVGDHVLALAGPGGQRADGEDGIGEDRQVAGGASLLDDPASSTRPRTTSAEAMSAVAACSRARRDAGPDPVAPTDQVPIGQPAGGRVLRRRHQPLDGVGDGAVAAIAVAGVEQIAALEELVGVGDDERRVPAELADQRSAQGEPGRGRQPAVHGAADQVVAEVEHRGCSRAPAGRRPRPAPPSPGRSAGVPSAGRAHDAHWARTTGHGEELDEPRPSGPSGADRLLDDGVETGWVAVVGGPLAVGDQLGRREGVAGRRRHDLGGERVTLVGGERRAPGPPTSSATSCGVSGSRRRAAHRPRPRPVGRGCRRRAAGGRGAGW